ncbi:MAG: DUF1127 domain-containing protein [Tistlia sp.]|uniref:DUF1127 domain-containing protein n=1 Tax=Tistlia sp. TaxID=3057121 RepID=UPI0034A40DE7
MSTRSLPSDLAGRRAGARAGPRLSASQAVPALVQLLLLWQERSNQRLRLRELDDHMLKDLGISRDQAWRESEKPFWRL